MHGAELTALPALAPARQEQLAPFRPADAGQVWVRWVGTQETEESFSFQLQAGGVRTEPLPVAEVDGRSYVQGSDLEAAVDGLRVDLPDGGFRYAVDWRPDLGQLGLWRAVRRPIS